MKNHLTKLYILSLLSGTLNTVAASTPDRPNIVFVFSDDHATQAIGAYEFELAELAPTPNIDRIADQGIRFDRCMVCNSICGPSRATILTGKYSHKNGFLINEGTEFDGSQVTFPKLLQKSGYQTAIIGKWHLGSEPTGFDYWQVLPGQGLYYRPEFLTPNGKIIEDGYVTDVITDKAIQWMETKRDKNMPFMLMVQHKAPHREWSPPAKYLDLFKNIKFPEPTTLFDDYSGHTSAAREQDMSINTTMEENKDLKVAARMKGSAFYSRVYSRLTPSEKEAWDKNLDQREKEYNDPSLKDTDLLRWKYQTYLKDYLACVRSVDDNIGRLQEYLKKSGLSENTVFIYSSDQGFYLGEHGWFDKRFMYDESYRTPLLMSWPGKIQPGSVNSNLVSNLDFAQTFLDIADAEAAPGMQGMSLVPLLAGEPSAQWRKYHYYHYYEYPGWHMVQRHEGVYDGRYKLIHFYDRNEWELIDTKTDPYELNSQYSNPEYTEVVKRMKQALQEVKTQYEVPSSIPAPRNVDNPEKYFSTKRRKIEQNKFNATH